MTVRFHQRTERIWNPRLSSELRANLTRSPAEHQEGVPPLELSPLAVWQRFPCKEHGNLAVQCEAPAYVNGLSQHMLRFVRYSTFPLTTPPARGAYALFLFFGGGRGRGGRATA